MGFGELSKRVLRTLRDGWAIAGLTILLVLALELAYRALGEVRRTVATIRSASPAWEALDSLSQVLLAHEDSTVALKWRPYVYYRRAPVRTSLISVDSAGLRTTPQAPSLGSPDTVYLFGGSTMWGSFQRDAHTLAATTSRVLADSGLGIYAKNYGETGYVLNQEVITLLRELQAGGRPKVVVFYDGINDLVALAQAATPGTTQNETNRAREFAVGRRLFHWEGDLKSDAVAWATASQALLSRSHLVQRLLRRPSELPSDGVADSTLINAYLDYYGSTIRIVEAIGREYGFCSAFVWQPTIHSTRKVLSAREAELVAQLKGASFGARLTNLHRLAVSELSNRVRDGVIEGNFTDLSKSLDDVAEELFVDAIGHTNERANGYLALRLADVISSCTR